MQPVVKAGLVERASMSRGRGRPYRPPLDGSPWSSVSGGISARVAWLLGTSRTLHAGGAYANRQEFLPELVDRDIRVDNTKLSRWESGTGSISAEVVQAYEEILGLPAQQLRSTVSLLTGASVAPTSAESPAAVERMLDGLVESVLSGENCSGERWILLTSQLAQHPAMFLRAALWRDLANRLISELSRSVGVAYTTRLVALRTLIAHPMAHNEVVAAIGQYVTDPCAVRVGDVIAALAHAPSASGRFLSLGLLASDHHAVRAGAARAVAAMKAANTWADGLDEALTKSIVHLLDPSSTPGSALTPAYGNADVLRYLGPEALATVIEELGDDRHRQFVLDHASLTSPATASLIAASITATAQESVPSIGDAPDPMLERLVREALFHSHAERRHRALVVLMSSPYAAGIGGAAAGLLNADDPLVARRAAELLRFCITPAETQHVLDAPVERHPDVQATALSALGHLPEFADSLVEEVLEQSEPWAGEREPQPVVYVLGMHGLTDRLAARALPSHVESAAAWWRRAGTRIAV